jgi:hypothetical protein
MLPIGLQHKWYSGDGKKSEHGHFNEPQFLWLMSGE